MPKIRIVLAEGHPLVREALKLLLCMDQGMDVAGETGDASEIERLVSELRPDLLLLDLDMPGCQVLRLAARIKARFGAAIKILILAGSVYADSVRGALAAGADAYVIKREDGSELLPALAAVLSGARYESKGLTDMYQ